MNSLAKTGKTYLLVILSAITMPEVLNVALRGLFAPESIDGVVLIRCILTAILLFFTYKGYSLARWIMSILLLFGGVLGTVYASSVLEQNKILGIILIFLCMFYAWSGMSLHSSEAIQSFFKYQQENRQK